MANEPRYIAPGQVVKINGGTYAGQGAAFVRWKETRRGPRAVLKIAGRVVELDAGRVDHGR